MKQKLFILLCISALSGCANTLQGAAKDGVANLKTASDWAQQNRDEIDAAAAKTGELLKKGGHLLGKGMEKTGGLLQEMTR